MLQSYFDPTIYEPTLPRKPEKGIIAEKGTSWSSKTPNIVWSNEELEQLSPHDSIEIFEFKSLKELEKSFMEVGDYTPKEVAELMQGFSRLPRYATKTTSKSRSTSRSGK